VSRFVERLNEEAFGKTQTFEIKLKWGAAVLRPYKSAEGIPNPAMKA
jgi:hypothetical protein